MFSEELYHNDLQRTNKNGLWKIRINVEVELHGGVGADMFGRRIFAGIFAHDRTGSCADRPVSRYVSKPEQLPVIQKTTVSNAGLVERWVDMLIRIMNFFMLTSW